MAKKDKSFFTQALVVGLSLADISKEKIGDYIEQVLKDKKTARKDIEKTVDHIVDSVEDLKKDVEERVRKELKNLSKKLESSGKSKSGKGKKKK